MRLAAIALVCALAATLAAQDYSDAAPSYGSMYAGSAGQAIWLGQGVTVDSTNPVTPAWTGDADDGVVGNPQWDSWSSENELTVELSGTTGLMQTAWGNFQMPARGWLLMWVDADDDGIFEPEEKYQYSPFLVESAQQVTFTGIKIHATQDFTRNGQNKVAVRITYQENIGGPPSTNQNGYFFIGEIEDWLIDVEPAKFVVRDEYLRSATETLGYSTTIKSANGTGPYTWSLDSGTLPSGLSLNQQGDNFILSGTPTVGAGTGLPTYSFTVKCVDGSGQVATRDFDLEVWPEPAAVPFTDSFSTDKGWKLDGNWVAAPVTGTAGSGFNVHGWVPAEPSSDFTPGSNDDYALQDDPGNPVGVELPETIWATSPKIDCSGLGSVELRYRRFLSHEGMQHLFVQVSGGGPWQTVWSHAPVQFDMVDIAWTREIIDISQWAAGKSQVQVRFGVGPTTVPKPYQNGHMGWSIDDVWVGETPIHSPLSATQIDLDTPTTFSGSGWPNALPVMYPGSVHDVSIDVDNPSTEDVQFTDVEVGITHAAPPGSYWIYPPAYDVNNTWFDVGDWTVSATVNIPAGGSGTVSVEFDCTGVTGQFAQLPFQGVIYLKGTQPGTGKDVEMRLPISVTFNAGPMPGLEVFEYQAGGTPVANNAPPANLRDFGSVAVGQTSGWLNIVLKNTSSTDINLGMPVVGGLDPNEFDLDTSAYTQLLTGGNTTYFSLRFAPNSTGAKNATVTFTHDAPNTASPFAFQIAGLGVTSAPIMEVRETGASGALIANGSAPTGGRDFGQQDISGGATTALTVYIENTGTQPLNLGAPGITGADAADFAILNAPGAGNLAPGSSLSFDLVFDPTTTGVKHATIEWTHNDPGQGSPFTFDVTGEGIINAPLISVYEGQAFGPPMVPGASPVGGFQFGWQLVSAGATQGVTVVISNDGWQPLNLGTPVLVGADAADYVLDLAGFSASVAGQATTSFEVAFDPQAKGHKLASIEFTHNDTTVVSPFEIRMEGYGDDPNGVTISTSALPPAFQSDPYSVFNLAAAGGTMPYTWSVVQGSLPAGITLTPDGALSGTPTSAEGDYLLRIRVTDDQGGTHERQFNLVVSSQVKKSPNGPDSGCTAGGSHWPAVLVLLLILAATLRRRCEA